MTAESSGPPRTTRLAGSNALFIVHSAATTPFSRMPFIQPVAACFTAKSGNVSHFSLVTVAISGLGISIVLLAGDVPATETAQSPTRRTSTGTPVFGLSDIFEGTAMPFGFVVGVCATPILAKPNKSSRGMDCLIIRHLRRRVVKLQVVRMNLIKEIRFAKIHPLTNDIGCCI